MGELDNPDPNAPKKPAIARFFSKAVEMTFKSQQAGRPIFEDREFVEVLIPGDRRTSVVEPVNDEHKARWPAAYKAFQEGLELPLEGTPLRNWPNSEMTLSRVEELAHFHIRTVEELAGVSDSHLQNLGMGARKLRENAKTFLEVAAKGTGPLERLISENHRLKDEVERLNRDLSEARADAKGFKDRLEAKEAAHARA